MSKHQTIKMIRLEIVRLNREIDSKIIMGISYAREAKRHRFLMSQLARLSPSSSWLGRSLGFVHTFLF